MADIRKIKLPDGNTYNLVPNMSLTYGSFGSSSVSLSSNVWKNVYTISTVKTGLYLCAGYARMTHTGAASRECEITDSSGTRLDISCSTRNSGSGEGTASFCGFIDVNNSLNNVKFNVRCGTTGTLTEWEIRLVRIGD